MLNINGLDDRSTQRTLHDLREVCGEWGILPESHVIRYQISKSTPKPDTASKYAEAWRGQMSPGEGGPTDVCIKVIKAENVHKVSGTPSPAPVQPVEQYFLGISRGGRTMGEVEPSKHPPVLWRYGRPVPNRDGMDAKWTSHGIRTDASGCRSRSSGEPPDPRNPRG